jgi:cytokinesis protein
MLVLLLGLTSGGDIRVRCSVRSQLESAGLLRVFQKVQSWNDETTMRMIRQYEEEAESDRRELAAEQDDKLLRSLRAPEDVFRALLDMTKGTKASAYLLDSLRHMLLIKDQGRVRYFQLIDKLISSIVMSDTPDLGGDFSRAFGVSVQHLMGRFVEQDRLDSALQETARAKAELARVTREKLELADEVAGGNDGLVGVLKGQVADLEEKLRKSRAATDALRDQMDGMKRDYEARIHDLEIIIQELFNMLRETDHLDTVQAMNQGPINREQLIHELREQWHRKNTIRKLEGKGKDGRPSEDDEDGEVLQAEKVPLEEARGEERPARRSKHASGSQFLDAPDEDVRAHIEDALIRGKDHIVSDLMPRALMSVSSEGRDTFAQHASSRWRYPDSSQDGYQRTADWREIDTPILKTSPATASPCRAAVPPPLAQLIGPNSISRRRGSGCFGLW